MVHAVDVVAQAPVGPTHVLSDRFSLSVLDRRRQNLGGTFEVVSLVKTILKVLGSILSDLLLSLIFGHVEAFDRV